MPGKCRISRGKPCWEPVLGAVTGLFGKLLGASLSRFQAVTFVTTVASCARWTANHRSPRQPRGLGTPAGGGCSYVYSRLGGAAMCRAVEIPQISVHSPEISRCIFCSRSCIRCCCSRIFFCPSSRRFCISFCCSCQHSCARCAALLAWTIAC